MSMSTTAQRATGLAAFLVVAFIGIGALNGTGTAAPSDGKEVVITDPDNPLRRAQVDGSGALRVAFDSAAPAEPVRSRATTTFDDTEEVKTIELYTVPTGKQLVVEQASLVAFLGAGSLYSAELQDGAPFGQPISHLIVHAQGNDNLGRAVFVSNQQVGFTLEEGETLGLIIRRDESGLGGFAEAAFTGYLVDAA